MRELTSRDPSPGARQGLPRPFAPRRARLPGLGIPDPRGWVGFGVIAAAVALHLSVPLDGRAFLVSSIPWVEILGHVVLLAGPPLALYLGVRNLLVDGTSPVPLVTVPLSALVTMLTAVGVTIALLS